MNAPHSSSRHKAAGGLRTVASGGFVLIVLALSLNLPRGQSNSIEYVTNKKLQTPSASDSSRSPGVQIILTPGAVNADDASEQAREDTWLGVSPVRRAALMSPEAMAPYDAILGSLHLSPRTLRRVKVLIVERSESASDADDLGRETRLNPEEISAVRAEAEAFFDRKFEAIADPENAEVIRRMLALTPQLEELTRIIEPDAAGRSGGLSTEQALQLAQFYKDEFTVTAEGLPVDRADGYDDQTGLAEADRRFLVKAAAVLNPAQLDRLRSRISRPAVASVETTR